jgi:uncharacterized phage-associated protein
MTSALNIAKLLIRLAHQGEEIDPLTPLRLQKLLYYVQGWSLAALGRPLFAERLLAWTRGPVVREVYDAFKQHGRETIPDEEGGEGEELSNTEKVFVSSVWDKYKQYSASALVQMTHNELPWLSARAGLGPTDHCDTEITRESLLAYFSEQIGKIDPAYKNVSLPGLWKGYEQMNRGEGRPAAEVFARIRARQ